MAQAATQPVTPATDKSQAHPLAAMTSGAHQDRKAPVAQSAVGSDGTAAPQYEEGSHTAHTNTKHTITDEKANPQLDTKRPLTDADHVASPTAVSPQSPDQKTSRVTGSATAGASVPSPHERAATAESGMTAEAKANLSKSEVKEAKQITKVLQKEQKEKDQALKTLIKELDKIQAVHKSALRDESKANAKHSKAVKLEHKTNVKFLSVKGKHEKAAAELKQRTEALAKKKEHSERQAKLLEEKTKEVEEARARKAVEDRERSQRQRDATALPRSVQGQ